MLAKFELLETEKQLLQKRLEKVEEKQSENQDNGFDPMGYFGHVKSSDLLRVAPEKNMEIPNRGVHSGMFADTPFASEELGAVKELKKSKEENYQKSEEEESEISGNDKVADVLIAALVSDIQLLLNNGVDFDEIHKILQENIDSNSPLVL
ncbi:uncharacterized protein [Antedon mediterranea]|uniref:uncharacterized protein isoform X1 n=1 Tax=Antedon mediterranea TaxID=105859 RepID=UPI003AF69F57